MAKNDFAAESPTNYEQKCLCTLVLDVSGSMSGKPIEELNLGIGKFYEEIQIDATTANRLEVCVITFGSEIECLQEPALVENFTMPQLTTYGSTKLVDGVREAIAKIEARKKYYNKSGQPYYRPWIILVTDGEPDDDQDIDGLAQEIHAATDDTQEGGKKYVFFAVGVERANMDILKKISSSKIPPAKLSGLKFSEFFQWLSASMTTITSSKDGDLVNLPNPEPWMDGFKV